MGRVITSVHRRGKRVLIGLEPTGDRPEEWIDCHNAMTGYWDYEDDPWCFDYIEAPRDAADHIRVRMSLSNGRVLRFHDARFFGRLRVIDRTGLMGLGIGPELMRTPHGPIDAEVISPERFARGILSDRRPVKVLLMDQSFVAGIGNIYANEGCHLAGIDPNIPACQVRPRQIPILLEALRCVMDHCIPTITYQWRRVYRSDLCGSCGHVVKRTEVAKRATFMCERCQGEPR